jgi:hypothetical protein
MARMSREFSLVLLGAGLLTAGYFLPEPDPVQLAADEATGGNTNSNNSYTTRRRARVGHIILFHTAASSPNRAFGTRSTTIRGGFGTSGGRFAGG